MCRMVNKDTIFVPSESSLIPTTNLNEDLLVCHLVVTTLMDFLYTKLRVVISKLTLGR